MYAGIYIIQLNHQNLIILTTQCDDDSLILLSLLMPPLMLAFVLWVFESVKMD